MTTEPTINPHVLFTVWSPDEVAECLLPSKYDHLYRELWKFVEELPMKSDPVTKERYLKYEVPEVYPEETLAHFWDRLTDEDKTILNNLALAQENE